MALRTDEQEFTREVLAQSQLMRHLVARAGQTIKVSCRGFVVEGFLKEISILHGWIEIDVPNREKTYFLNIHKIEWMETPGTDEIIRIKNQQKRA